MTTTTTKPAAPLTLVTEAPPRLPTIQSGGKIAAIIPTTFEDAWRIANVAVKSGFAPKDINTAEKAMVCIMHGMEVGLPPMAALQSIAVINGRPTIWGDAAIGLVRSSGLCTYIKEWEEKVEETPTAFCVTLRRGEEEPITRKFSLADQVVAGLMDKPIHRAYPQRMRQMRARAFCLRDAYADVLKGIAIREEVMDYDTPAATNIPPPPPPPPPPATAQQASAAAPDMVTWEDPPADAQAAPVPPPIPTAKEVMPAEQINATVATQLVKEVMPDSTNKSSPISEGNEPRPANPVPPPGEAQPTYPDIPPGIDRRPKPESPPDPEDAPPAATYTPTSYLDEEAEWLRNLEGAFSGCEDLATFGEQQRALMAPQHGKVRPEAWRQAMKLTSEHSGRIIRALSEG